MSYSKRIQIAAALSVLLHVTALVAWHNLPAPTAPSALVVPEPAPIEIDLQPEPDSAPQPVQLVDVATPAPQLVPPTPLIAEDNSEAMDDTPDNGNRPAPQLEQDEFDQLAAMPAPPREPAPMPRPPSKEATDTEKPKEAEEAPKREPELEYEKMESQLEEIITSANETPEAAPEDNAPIKIAQLDPSQSERRTREMTRNPTGFAREGATNFQAIQSEIAPYLRQVRAQVEREWNEMLYTRYSGSSPVKAVIDCAISPDGRLISVEVVGTQNDRLYSALCKDAVQRAGPFGPFPFEVPDIYRDKNLEIRWTFSFL